MGWSKRRKGKQGSGRNTPVSRSSTTGNEPTGEEESSTAADTDAPIVAAAATTTTTQDKASKDATVETRNTDRSNKSNKKKEVKTDAAEEQPGKDEAEENKEDSSFDSDANDADLVLTSEKRRGVYECDYCRSDISQLPRIRCALCQDFDLCLDCFATTDHSAAIARLKAAATAHSELAADGIASTLVAGISINGANHDDTHGYRVCDSTRYPVFGSARSVVKFNPMTLQAGVAPLKTSLIKEGDEEKEPKETALAPAPAQELGEENPLDKTMHGNESSETQPQESSTTMKDDSKDVDGAEYRWIVNDDPKSIWTAEEDLRLLDAIKTHGLGNWTDISDAVGGNGSVGKTPKRCMERYFDDFLGRYGHILPQYTILGENISDEEAMTASTNGAEATNTIETESMEDWEDESARSTSKRRQLLRTPSNISGSSAVGGSRARKRYKVIPTETLPGYQELWPDPYLPPIEGVKMGQEVARDLSTKNELTFVKLIAAASSKEEADNIRREWEEKGRKQRIGAPTVLPPRPEDSASLPGAELVGFMPRRGDFDIEHENEAEQALADMEFLETDTEQEKQLKIQVLHIFYQKQNEREKRRQFILSRNLYDYRKYIKNEHDLPQDERDLRHRMRLFERFHTPQEHKLFIDDIIKAKRLRKEIAKLQMYRRIGIRSLAEAEKYELDKTRRQFHKVAQLQKEGEAKDAAAASAAAGVVPPQSTTGAATAATLTPSLTASAAVAVASSATSPSIAHSSPPSESGESSLWKQYRTAERKVRRSINRSGSGVSVDDREEVNKATPTDCGKDAFTTLASKQEGVGGKETKAEDDSNVGTIETDKMDTDVVKPTVSNTDPMQLDDEPSVQGKPNAVDSKHKEMQVCSEANDDEDVFDITNCRGYDLLSRREADLCMDLKLYPVQYLEIKKALVHESMMKGLLDKEGPGLMRRVVVKLDIKRRGDVIDFMLRAGWISNRLADVARIVTPPPTTPED